jgi:hypothetical protein
MLRNQHEHEPAADLDKRRGYRPRSFEFGDHLLGE